MNISLSNNPKKATVFIVVFALYIFFNTNVVFGHSPTGMDLEYDEMNETLEVNIIHTVEDPEDHYIERVEIMKNGELFASEDYASQPSNSSFSYSYEISASTNDVIQVDAICNRFGSISKSISPSENGPNETENNGIPWLPVGGIVILVIIIVAVVIYKRS